MEAALRVKPYESREETDLDGNLFYILSFDRSQHIKVSSRAKLIIDQLDGTRSRAEILAALEARNMKITEQELDYFIRKFLLPKQVLAGEKAATEGAKKNNLWIHLPLVESRRFRGLYGILQYLFAGKFIVIPVLSAVFLAGVHSIWLLLHDPEPLMANLNSLLILLLVYASMFVHELGHATAAYKYGVQVGKIGVGVYLTYFVFFVDMTGTWRLSRTERIVTDVGGMYFQILTILPLYVAYLFTGNVSLLAAAALILMTSAMNLLPMLRMDGYWLLMDYLNVQNIQVQAFRSIRRLAVELRRSRSARRKGEEHKIGKTTLVYGIYSGVYVLTASLFVLWIAYSLAELIRDHRVLADKLVVLHTSLVQGDFSAFLLNLNNVFILIIPVIFIANFMISVIRKGLITMKIRGGLRS